MQIIKEQFGRIKHFLIILIPLFLVNAIFNLRYDWGGISLIARVYIMVLSFYIIFIFSQLKTDEYRTGYVNAYGWKGKYYLFFITRIFPFVFIYFLTIIFTLINYLNKADWPVEPVLRLFDGRYSNTIIYSLILFIVLKQKKRPGISIPLFIICSVLYFAIDKILYNMFDPGIGVSIIKLTKYIMFIFVLIYSYSKSRWRILESLIFSFITGCILFASVFSLFLTTFFMSTPEGPAFSISEEILLKSGFIFPLDKLQNKIIDNGTYTETKNVFYFIEKYNRDTGYTTSDWEKIISRNRIEKNEYIFNHLNKKNIKLDFKMVRTYAEIQLQIPPQDMSNLGSFAQHMALYYNKNKNEFYSMYKSGNDPLKLLILKSLAYTDDIDALNFLIDNLTNVDITRAKTAYNSLKKITGKDPAVDMKKDVYDLDVVLFFRDYVSRNKLIH